MDVFEIVPQGTISQKEGWIDFGDYKWNHF